MTNNESPSIDLSKCPRCQGEWQYHAEEKHETLAVCRNCRIMSFRRGISLEIDDDHSINWRYESHTCLAISKNHSADDLNISRLPWLPFDIDLERLKKLLVFS